MKRILLAAFTIVLSLALFSCNKNSSKDESALKTAEAVSGTTELSEGFVPVPPNTDSSNENANENADDPFYAKKVDIDFTKLNFNMASAQIFNMLVEEDNYIGKTLKIRGMLYVGENPKGEKTLSVLYYDATACCQTGLTIVLPEGMKHPEDFPDSAKDIAVVGTYETEDVEGITYTYVACSEVYFY